MAAAVRRLRGSFAHLDDGGVEEFLRDKRCQIQRELERDRGDGAATRTDDEREAARQEAIDRLLGAFADLPGGSVDDFLAEKRAEVARELEREAQ